jgi:hypothetical protein
VESVFDVGLALLFAACELVLGWLTVSKELDLPMTAIESGSLKPTRALQHKAQKEEDVLQGT